MSLRKTAFSAGRWTTASLLLRVSLQFAQTAILARILTPADFGVMAMVMATYGVVALLIDLGLSNALIHFQNPSQIVLSSLYWLNLGGALVMMLILMGLAWPMSTLYGEPQLLPAMVVMSLAMPLNALGQQFRVMAEKELRFSKLAIVEVVAASVGFVVAVLMAVVHGDVYAFISGILATAATSSLLAWLFLSAGRRPDFSFRLSEVKGHLYYGSFRLGDTLLISAQMQSDALLGGALAGSSAIGVYTLPRDLTLRLANTVVNPVVTRVGLPVMARVQADKSALRFIYLQTMRMTSSVNFPIYAALAIWANEAVYIMLGPQWHEAGAFMRLFAIWGMIRSTGNPVGSLLNATGQVRRAFWWDLGLLLIIPGLFYLGFQVGGLHGIAVTMLCIQVVTFYPHYRLLVRPVCGATFADYVGALLPAFMATALTAVTGIVVSSLVGSNVWLRVLCGGFAGMATYLLVSYFINRHWLLAMRELVLPMLPRMRRRGTDLTAKEA